MKPLKNISNGFTLVEILISLAISGIVLAGVLSIFDNSNKSYILQEDIARMQQNVRMAKYYIEKDLRMTGYGVQTLAFDGQLIKPLTFKNNTQGDSKVHNDTDTLSITYVDDDEGGCGSTPGANRSCADLPQLLLQGEKPPTSTVAEVKVYMKDHPPYSWWAEGCSCGGVDYDSPKFGFQALITSPDGSKSDIVFVTGVSAKKEGSDSTISNGPNFTALDGVTYSNKQLNTYPDGSTISFFNSNSLVNIGYYIDKKNYLRRSVAGNANKISENIEDIQIGFCGDYNGDGVINLSYDPANPDDSNDDWFDEGNLVSGELSDTDIEKIRFIRVTILGRTSREYKGGITSKRPGIEDHTAATQSDGYHRRLLSFTVQVHNFDLDN
ncbi:prepilin-type N-terminal cleavage/methylation domain-containing protein [Desulfocicer vacuolatum DSM 3385]|uniref:Prepilin-type N-terminal cleavage/methylation domain-containing protein n=1 Tax=Desulfocicer vacuolatum DSM 3385 TaxID=1121400 RepID=A0A1W1ZHJ5_9BACT|nr:PilW family protein [Desulfocicer vacuolatum]SMC47518.1 prepilin-type N-terminal cleavage/methylation domain-containing protein [Desulfocicer vacuolatum DSM 3385]